ncbi:cobalt ECF transporter T component CbiQ [Castellaniella sp.]|uniref:cobalt ECF transporter T component CbiQ n=1 Tax=Castellaniella sp. TaxID=1955812 RepID=UPI0035644BE7
MMRPHDLRLRLLAVFAALLVFTPVQGLAPAATGVVAVLALYAARRQAIAWKRLFHLEGFLILLLITLPFTVPGAELFRLGPWVASAEGFARALALACKVTASVLLISLLFASVEVLSLGAALRGLHVPEMLVRLFVAVVRYLGLIQSEFRRLHESMRARAFVPRSGRHTWRSYGYLLGMLLVRAMERAERVEEAMRLRGYSGRFPQTHLPAPSAADWLALVGWVAGAALLLGWDAIWMN